MQIGIYGALFSLKTGINSSIRLFCVTQEVHNSPVFQFAVRLSTRSSSAL